jgi:MerR family transcriptional regulator, copper efflux regulator
MDQKLTIGKVAHQSGMSVPTIRFYEAEGIIPTPKRTEAGYRLYSSNDVRRLRLARRARLLGLSLPEVKALVDRAFSSECGAYAQEILQLVATQRARIDQQIAELQALRSELDTLEQDARQISSDVPLGLTVAECGHCLLTDGESGGGGYCKCSSPQQAIPPESLTDHRMSEQLTPEVVDALECEPGKRPSGAPTIEDIIGSVTSLHREADSLVVEFDPAAAEKVQAVVEAERQCCSTIGWQVETDHRTQLRITARPLQLETLEAMFSPAESART